MNTKKMIFFSTGWMPRYDGSDANQLTGGGKYPEETGEGGEIYNFLSFRDNYYGYVSPRQGKIQKRENLEGKIGIEGIGADKKDEYEDNVLVLWVAKSPEKNAGVRLVGWYKNAKVYRSLQRLADDKRRKKSIFGYYAVADAIDCRLLKINERTLRVPTGKNGFGQSHIWYAKKNIAFKNKVLEFIQNSKFGKNSNVYKSFENIEDELDKKVAASLSISPKERRRRLSVARRIPKKTEIISIAYIRNPDVIAEVLSRANGFCEVCKMKAPFLRATDETPYLEIHHEIPLAKGGEDVIENAVAVCPNCHRKAHFGVIAQKN
jgi:5-methylcytosine-specific restriction endonuclease McrA